MIKPLKRHGRKGPNALYKLLVCVSIAVAVAAIWLSIGVSIANAGDVAVKGFADFGMALGGQATVAKLGGAAVPAAIASVIFYLSLIVLVLGAIAMSQRKHGDRIPGLVAAFVAAIGFGFLLTTTYELRAAKAISDVFGYGAVVFLVLLFVLIIFCTFKALTFPVEEVQEVVVPAPARKEELKFATDEPRQEPEPEPEPKPETEPEPEPEPAPVVVPAVAAVEEQGEDDVDFFDTLGNRRKRIPFENKVRHADTDTRDRYRDIVNALREYDFNDRMSIPGETFSYKRKRLIFITMAGKTLKVHFAIDPREFADSTVPMKDASEAKKFEDIPSYLIVKSDLAVRRVIALAQRLAEENNVPKK